MEKLSKEIKILVFSIVVVVGFLIFSFVTEAGIGLSDFGGKITSKQRCTCNSDGSSQVTITGMPSIFTGTYLYSPISTRVIKGTVTSNRQIIGKYTSGGVCRIGQEPYCTTLPITKGTMKKVITSGAY